MVDNKKQIWQFMFSNHGDNFFFFRNPTEEMINDYFWDFMNLS